MENAKKVYIWTRVSCWNTVVDLGYGSQLKETLVWPWLEKTCISVDPGGSSLEVHSWWVARYCTRGLRLHNYTRNQPNKFGKVLLGHYFGIPPAQIYAFNTLNICWLELILSRLVALWLARGWASCAFLWQRHWWKRGCCRDHQACAMGPSILANAHGHRRKHQTCQWGMPGKLEQQAEKGKNSLNLLLLLLKTGECRCDRTLPVTLAPSRYQWLIWRKV